MQQAEHEPNSLHQVRTGPHAQLSVILLAVESIVDSLERPDFAPWEQQLSHGLPCVPQV